MKKYQLFDIEAGIAMGFGVLGMLTVIDPEKLSVHGVAWVKTKIKQRCDSQNVSYSRSKYINFGTIFTKLGLDHIRQNCGIFMEYDEKL
ncbi:hypothetical protein F442_01152 [Phytophthora nicotianae P10297]|uniref:Uncharacterized protein n=1 Tax=Phytophthora nicotianae P10297 TaxID=1317064 RepID=W3A451_PHYNI|nr:hypothetical protein F442_01152 [Phytophthora nicotianae P10297]